MLPVVCGTFVAFIGDQFSLISNLEPVLSFKQTCIKFHKIEYITFATGRQEGLYMGVRKCGNFFRFSCRGGWQSARNPFIRHCERSEAIQGFHLCVFSGLPRCFAPRNDRDTGGTITIVPYRIDSEWVHVVTAGGRMPPLRLCPDCLQDRNQGRTLFAPAEINAVGHCHIYASSCKISSSPCLR